ncbi:uncharacterized protein LOC135195890 [Macrobrachium nipponense]|uniref:uncharacterized protein LOC135195890 n=1 Tax=Macrobrachium nipponense TaxID=159736 RepID=UPI0030C81696
MRTKVITAVGETENFEVSVGLHQRSALSPFLFVLVMDVLSEASRNEELWELCTLMITDGNEEDLQRRVGEWQESLESGGLKPLTRKEEVKLQRTEMRMLWWIMGLSLLERLEKDEIRRVGLVKITDVIRESQLRWYGHVLRMDDEEGVKKAWEEPVRGRRSRGRQ